MKLSEAISKRVNDLLEKREWTQYELSKQSGVPRSTINRIVRCQRNKVTMDTVYQIASTMGMTLKEFFGDTIFDEVTD